VDVKESAPPGSVSWCQVENSCLSVKVETKYTYTIPLFTEKPALETIRRSTRKWQLPKRKKWGGKPQNVLPLDLKKGDREKGGGTREIFLTLCWGGRRATARLPREGKTSAKMRLSESPKKKKKKRASCSPPRRGKKKKAKELVA